MKAFFRFYRSAFEGLPAAVWRISIAFLINRTGTMVLPFLSLYLTLQLGFSKLSAGWVLAAYGVGSICGSLVGGRLTARVGANAVMNGSLVSTGLVFVAMVGVTGYREVVVLTCGCRSSATRVEA